MNALPSIFILATAYLVVFVEATFSGVRHLIGVQLDLLPSLMVYASLSRGLPTITSLAVCGGLWFDSISSNPLGVSILPLFVTGLVIQRYKGLILRSETFAQRLLGFFASIAVPVLTLIIVLNTDRKPLLGWFLIWQLLLLGVAGAIFTPFWFTIFDRVSNALSYRPHQQTTFRPDRQIKRGRK